MGARESETLIFPLTLGDYRLLLWLRHPKFCACFLSLEIRRSWCGCYNFLVELLEVQVLQAFSLLIVAITNLGLSGGHLTSLVLAVVHDLLGYSPHVDRCLPFLPFWLHLLMTLMVIMILILMVQILHLLCLHLLQLFMTFLVDGPHVDRHHPFPPFWL